MPKLDPTLAKGIVDAAHALGLHPFELGAIINFESGFRPLAKNPTTTKNGSQIGLIQMGDLARRQYGFDLDNPMTQVGANGAIVKYMRGHGYQNGMGIQKAYATINGGNPNSNGVDNDGTTVNQKVQKILNSHIAIAKQALSPYVSNSDPQIIQLSASKQRVNPRIGESQTFEMGSGQNTATPHDLWDASGSPRGLPQNNQQPPTQYNFNDLMAQSKNVLAELMASSSPKNNALIDMASSRPLNTLL